MTGPSGPDPSKLHNTWGFGFGLESDGLRRDHPRRPSESQFLLTRKAGSSHSRERFQPDPENRFLHQVAECLQRREH